MTFATFDEVLVFAAEVESWTAEVESWTAEVESCLPKSKAGLPVSKAGHARQSGKLIAHMHRRSKLAGGIQYKHVNSMKSDTRYTDYEE